MNIGDDELKLESRHIRLGGIGKATNIRMVLSIIPCVFVVSCFTVIGLVLGVLSSTYMSDHV